MSEGGVRICFEKSQCSTPIDSRMIQAESATAATMAILFQPIRLGTSLTSSLLV